MRATLERGWQVRNGKYKTKEILAIVKENFQKHKKEYEEACEGYRNQAMRLLAERANELQNSKSTDEDQVDLRFNIVPPPDHRKDYEAAIKMLELEQDEVITIQGDQFTCFVMDDWGWKESFKLSHKAYTSIMR